MVSELRSDYKRFAEPSNWQRPNARCESLPISQVYVPAKRRSAAPDIAEACGISKRPFCRDGDRLILVEGLHRPKLKALGRKLSSGFL